MEITFTDQEYAQLREWLTALGDKSPEIHQDAQTKLIAWLSQNPDFPPHRLLGLSIQIGSELQGQRLAPILGEFASLDTIRTLADHAHMSIPLGMTARHAIGHWIQRATPPDAAQGISICLDTGYNHQKVVFFIYILESAKERILRTPNAAFWPVVRKLESHARRYPEAAQAAAYLAGLLPTPDLPRTSEGSASTSADLPVPAGNNTHNSRDLPIPALAAPIQFLRSWWRRWKR